MSVQLMMLMVPFWSFVLVDFGVELLAAVGCPTGVNMKWTVVMDSLSAHGSPLP